jgi:hypothetical protein
LLFDDGDDWLIQVLDRAVHLFARVLFAVNLMSVIHDFVLHGQSPYSLNQDKFLRKQLPKAPTNSYLLLKMAGSDDHLVGVD